MQVLENTLYEQKKCAFGQDIITLFTPTYNRAKFIPRLYRMLIDQTSKQFVWIVVDDGSSDDTSTIMKGLVNENIIPILYIRKENGGKHSAFKVALEKCFTEYFQCMDDDDIYSKEAVATYLREWGNIKSEQRNDIGAIRTISRKSDGRFVCNRPDAIIEGTKEDCDTLTMNYVRGLQQENWTCYRTDALRDIDLFPSDYWLKEQHKFYIESLWQGRFARKYKCRYYYISLREYTDDAEFSIIRSNKSKQHYWDMFINGKMVLDEQWDYISHSFMRGFKQIVMIQLLRGFLDINLKELKNNTVNPTLRTYYNLTAPISLLGNTIIRSRNKS